MEYPESGADAANSLADPNGFRYGAGASEGELTLPRASTAAFEVPQAANWHVHLELRPEELVALHKLGLTRGAIAWREGMAAWQPLRESQEPVGLGSEILGRAAMPSSSDLEPTISSSASDWSDAVTVASDRAPEPGSHLAPAGEDDNSVILLSPRVRRATLPPTSPLFTAAARPHVAAVATPARSRNGGGSGSSFPPPPAVLAPVGDPAKPLPLGGPVTAAARLPAAPRLPSFDLPDPSAFSAFPTASVPATAFEPSGVQPAFKRRSLWLGAIGLAVASAVLGSIVSGVFSKPTVAAQDKPVVTATATIDATATAAANAGGLAPIPIDQLPVADTAARLGAAPAARTAPAARDERKSERDESRSSSPAAASEPTPREEPPRKHSPLNDAIAHAAGSGPPASESEPEAADDEASAAQPARASAGPDLKAISKAVNAAARAASACGASPQSGRVAITFSPSGAVRSVQMEQQFDERDVGSCVLRAMGRAKVGAFAGDPVTVRKSVSW